MRRIGSRYRITDETPLGRGATGVVFAGEDEAGEPVAIKLLAAHLVDDPGVVTRFARERSLLSGVRNPYVVAVHDLVIEGDTLAIVMDLVPGSTLKDWMAASADVSAEEVARIGRHIAAGLTALHDAGIVHRDLKPANILMDPDAKPRITDFGISLLVDEQEQVTSALGTPQYISPEALRLQPLTPAADIYALGLVLYELAAGAPAFSGSTRELTKAHLELMPRRPDNVPDFLWAVIASALSKDPLTRPTAREVAAAPGTPGARPMLPRRAATPDTVPVPPTQVMTAPPKHDRTPAVVVVLLVLVLAAAVLLLNRPDPTARPAPSPSASPTSLNPCDGGPFPFEDPLSDSKSTTVLRQVRASRSISPVAWRTKSDNGKGKGKAKGKAKGHAKKAPAPAPEPVAPQAPMTLAQLQASWGLPATGRVDARMWELLQQRYC